MNRYPYSRDKREGIFDIVQNKKNKGKGKISYEDSICCEARTGCDLERV